MGTLYIHTIGKQKFPAYRYLDKTVSGAGDMVKPPTVLQPEMGGGACTDTFRSSIDAIYKTGHEGRNSQSPVFVAFLV